LRAASRQGRGWAGKEEGKEEGKGVREEGEVEGREREGPKLLLNQGPSEPCCATDWRRYIVKSGVKSVRSSRQTVSGVDVLVLPSILNASLSSLMIRNSQSYPTTVLNKKLTF